MTSLTLKWLCLASINESLRIRRSCMKKRVIQTGKGSKSKERTERLKVLQEEPNTPDSRVELIQLLIPLGLQAVEEELQAEVARLVGARYSREQAAQKR